MGTPAENRPKTEGGRPARRVKGKRYKNLMAHILLSVFAIIAVAPFIWMLLTAFKTEPEATTLQLYPTGISIKLDEEDESFIVEEVLADSLGEEAGFLKGDVISSVDGGDVPEEFSVDVDGTITGTGRLVIVGVKREGEGQEVVLDVKRGGFAIFPKKWQWVNFQTLFQQHPMAIYYLNSGIYTILRTLPALFLASLTGFVIAKYRFRARRLMWFLIIGTLIVPFQLRLIPMANMLFGMGLKNEYWAVVLPGLLDPFGIFLFIQACRSIPDELLESARIDGCGIWRQYVNVALPLIGPTLAAYAIILFMWSWGEFLWSFIVITEAARMPLEVGIKGFSGEHYATVVHMMSAATVAIIPVVVVFLILQRQFVKGVTMSGLKG